MSVRRILNEINNIEKFLKNHKEYLGEEYDKYQTTLNELRLKVKLKEIENNVMNALTLKSNKEYYKYFYSAEALESELTSISSKKKESTIRGSVFSNSMYENLSIEVMKLTCKLGCQNCSIVRDRTLGPDLNYYPCLECSS